MAKQTITNYDVENYEGIAENYDVGDVVSSDDYQALTDDPDADVDDPVSTADNEGEEVEWTAEELDERFTKAELKERCEDLDLAVSGSKDELIYRLLN
jgi:hypothetical protein